MVGGFVLHTKETTAPLPQTALHVSRRNYPPSTSPADSPGASARRNSNSRTINPDASRASFSATSTRPRRYPAGLRLLHLLLILRAFAPQEILENLLAPRLEQLVGLRSCPPPSSLSPPQPPTCPLWPPDRRNPLPTHPHRRSPPETSTRRPRGPPAPAAPSVLVGVVVEPVGVGVLVGVEFGPIRVWSRS